MAGFKQTIIDHNPVLFLTFDGDAYDESTKILAGPSNEIIDESLFSNPGIMQSDHIGYGSSSYGYRMGMTSQVHLEPSEQAAISFGYYGYNAVAPQGPWAKAFIEVSHQSQYNFYNGSTKLGDFTVGFILNREDEAHFRATSGYGFSTLTRHLVKKNAVLDIYIIDYYSASDTINFLTPGGLMSVAISPLLTFYGREHLITFTWKVVSPVVGSYVGTATAYLDSRIIAEQSWSYIGSPPNTAQNTPWEIMGTIASGGVLMDDRQTSNSTFDQFFVLDKALSPNQVSHLVKKMRVYSELVQYSNPHSYWPMDDFPIFGSTTILAQFGSNGEYVGDSIVRRRPGPENIPGTLSALFQNGSMGVVRYVSYAGGKISYFNPSADYSISFYIKPTSGQRGVIFAMQADTEEYPGILLQYNFAENVYSPGALQFSVKEFAHVSVQSTDIADGGFHHICMVRRGTNIELWVDHVMLGEAPVPLVNSAAGPGQVYFMGAPPGHLWTEGNLCQVEIHNYALQDQEISMRWNYAKSYRISGTVTLQGNAHQASVRLMNHRTGEFITEVVSDINDGAYAATLYNNTTLDLIAINPDNISIRPRVYGPVYPTHHDDPA